MNSKYLYSAYSFIETEYQSGYTYADDDREAGLVHWFAQAPFSLDVNKDSKTDVIVPMVRGYFSGLDTRASYVGLENVDGRLMLSSWLNEQMPYTIGARRAESIFLEKDNLHSYVTISNDAGYEQSIGGELINISQVNDDGSIRPDYLKVPQSSEGDSYRANSHALATGDINRDGTEDLLVGNGGIDKPFALLQSQESDFYLDGTNEGFYLNLAHDAKAMVNPGAGAGFNMLLDLHLQDFNNDGFDLIAGWGHGSALSSIYLNNSGEFSAENSLELPVSIYGVDNQMHLKTLSADFDRDGDQDMVVLWSRYEPFYGGNYLQYLENDGTGHFADRTTQAFSDPFKDSFDSKLQWTNYWQLLDVNSDGTIDIVGTRSGDQTEALVLINNGAGQFAEYTFQTPDSEFGSIIQWGDFDANGKIEYVTFETQWQDASSKNSFNVYEVDALFPRLTVSGDTEGVAGQAYRIYKAAFDRAPDLAGLGYWINAMDEGADLASVAGGFITSAEFQSQHGSVGNSDFIRLLYENVLDRQPDDQGYAFWQGAMSSGTTREEILTSFSESTENKANVAGLISNGIEYTTFVG